MSAAPERGYRSFLNLDEIVGHARAIAEADGLAAVSMRTLADRSGCSPRALYRHVSGKEEVLELIADAALGELGGPRDDLPWDDALVEFFTRMRELLIAAPAVAEIIAQLPVAGRNFRAHGDALVVLLLGAGLSPQDAVEAMVTLGQFTIGASMPGTGERLNEAYRKGTESGSRHDLVRRHFVAGSAARHFDTALRRLVRAYSPKPVRAVPRASASPARAFRPR